MRNTANIIDKSTMTVCQRRSIRLGKAVFFTIAILLSIPQTDAGWPGNHLSGSSLLRRMDNPPGWQDLPDELLTLPTTKNRYPGILLAKSNSVLSRIEYPFIDRPSRS